jgi:hypothetical protein
LNEFDYFVKHVLKAPYYVRYTDDFVLVAERREDLCAMQPKIEGFLREKLALTLHPKKIILRPIHQGIDFLGYVIFPTHLVLRTKTKHRIFAKLQQKTNECSMGAITHTSFEQSLQSYLGVLSHANTYRLRNELLMKCWRLLTLREADDSMKSRGRSTAYFINR